MTRRPSRRLMPVLAAALLLTTSIPAIAQQPSAAPPARDAALAGPRLAQFQRSEPVATESTAPAFRKQDDSPRFNVSFTLLGLALIILLIVLL